MGEAITLHISSKSHRAGPVTFGTICGPVAHLPDLIDREALIIEDPLLALGVSPAADGTANVLSPIFPLQNVDNNVALGTKGGHWLSWDGISRLNLLPLERLRKQLLDDLGAVVAHGGHRFIFQFFSFFNLRSHSSNSASISLAKFLVFLS